MKRILVIGCCGAGKSKFALKLKGKTEINVIHLDKYYWKPNWVETLRDNWNEIVRNMIKEDEWIIDGNYTSTLEMRIERADTVYYFDFPIWRCLIRIFRRIILSKLGIEKRGDMAEGCPEKFDANFIKYVLNFNKVFTPRIESILERNKHKNIFRIKNDREAKLILRSIG
jgi:adenylate kinase family enzyme